MIPRSFCAFFVFAWARTTSASNPPPPAPPTRARQEECDVISLRFAKLPGEANGLSRQRRPNSAMCGEKRGPGLPEVPPFSPFHMEAVDVRGIGPGLDHLTVKGTGPCRVPCSFGRVSFLTALPVGGYWGMEYGLLNVKGTALLKAVSLAGRCWMIHAQGFASVLYPY